MTKSIERVFLYLPHLIIFSLIFHSTPRVSAFVHNNRFLSSSLSQNLIAMSSHKRQKLDTTPASTKLIATHSGTFQADEALGVWILRQTNIFRNSPVIRTRDPKVYSEADVVIDVGGVYNHEEKKYDHHQRGYEEHFSPKIKKDDDGNEIEVERCTKLSASGLVYRHYGKEVISNLYPSLSEKEIEKVYLKMYNSFMEPIDAIDTGVEQVAKDVEMVYYESTGLSSRVSRLNPRWNEKDPAPDPDERFADASALCGQDFLGILTKIVESDLPAREFVEKAVLERHNVDPSGEIIRFVSGGLPWKNHLYDLEDEYKLDPLVKFVLYTDQSGMWRVQAVSVKGQAFENRLGLPEEWRGVRDEDLAKLAGIEGCCFCHAAGFIGGNKTFEGALEMAKVALTRK